MKNLYYGIEHNIRNCEAYGIKEVYKDLSLLGYAKEGPKKFTLKHTNKEITGMKFYGGSYRLFKHVIVCSNELPAHPGNIVVSFYIVSSRGVEYKDSFTLGSVNSSSYMRMYCYTYRIIKILDKSVKVKQEDIDRELWQLLDRECTRYEDEFYQHVNAKFRLGNAEIKYSVEYNDISMALKFPESNNIKGIIPLRVFNATKLGIEAMGGIINYYQELGKMSRVLS